MTSKQESGHWIQQSVHFTQVSKLTTGRMVRVVNFLKYGLRSGTYPFPASFGLPTGIAGIVTPSRISHHFGIDRKSTRLNSSHVEISYAVFCLKKKNTLSPRAVLTNPSRYCQSL